MSKTPSRNLFNLALANNTTVARTRAEIALHILIESFLKADHGAEIPCGTVIDVAELDEADLEPQSPQPGLTTPSSVQSGDVSAQQAAPDDAADSDQVSMDKPESPSKHSAFASAAGEPEPKGSAQHGVDFDSSQEEEDLAIPLRVQIGSGRQRSGQNNSPARQSQDGTFDSFCHRPEEFKDAYVKKLNEARRRGRTSVTFPLDWISQKASRTTSTEDDKSPETAAVALAIATVARHLRYHEGLELSATFEVESAHEQRICERLIAQANELAEESTYQALLRGVITKPSIATDPIDFLNRERPAAYVPPAVHFDRNAGLVVLEPASLPASLNGTLFRPKKAANARPKQNATLAEPAYGHIRAAGAVIVEENGDGRVWVVEPTNQFMQLTTTFPKGRRADGLTPQQTAVKEACEESGLEIELTGFLCDAGRDNTTRYYLARRIGGSPANAEWESQAVKLVPPQQLLDLFAGAHHERDYAVAQRMIEVMATGAHVSG